MVANAGTKVRVRPLPHPWHGDMSEVQTRRYRRRSSRSRRREIRAAAISVVSAFVIIAAFAAAVLFLGPLNEARVAPLTTGSDEAVIADDIALEAARDESSRTVYPFSVVPGGVYSPEDLAQAVASDPVVSAHYGDVIPAAFHVENVNGPRQAYMSYRIGDQIYWTKRKLALHDGERVLSDGSVTLRARCGNQLSDEPRQPTSDAEPPVQAFEGAPAAPVLPALPFAAAPPMEPGMQPLSSPDPWNSIPYLGGIGTFALNSFISPIDDETVDSPEDDVTDPPIAFVIPPFTGGGDGHYSDEGPVTPQVPGLTPLNPPSGGHPSDGPPNGAPPLGDPHTPGGGSDGELPPPVVPEPTSLTLFGTGAVWLAIKRYRARKP
jgi:hypothetical protein